MTNGEASANRGWVQRAAVGLMGAGFVVLAVQLGLASWFNGRILPGVSVGDVAVGGLTLPAARQRLISLEDSYHARFVVAGTTYSPTPDELGASFDLDSALTTAYQTGRSGNMVTPHAGTNIPLAVTTDEAKLSSYLESIVVRYGTQPVDASLKLSGGRLVPVPEQSGVTISRAGLQRVILANLTSLKPGTPVTQPHVVDAQIRTTDLTSTIAAAQGLMQTPVTMTYQTTVIHPSAADIGGWLRFDRTGSDDHPVLTPIVDPAKVAAYVASLARRLDVAPDDEHVTVINGVSTTNNAGQDGTAIDQAPLAGALLGLAAAQPLSVTITDHPVAFKQVSTTLISLDAGRYIEINLSKQHLWVWDDHQVVYESPITSGATGAGFPTIQGKFAIYQKNTDRYLNGHNLGYNYNVFVHYWMAFSGDYGLHDASWRNGNFGGQDYWRGGSHGCVNLPDATAAWLYDWSTIGTPVWVHA